MEPDTASHLTKHIVLSDYHHRTYLERNWVTNGTTIRQAHDPSALGAALSFMRYWQPDVIHLAGDWVDFYKISRFCRIPPDEDELFHSVTAVRKIFGAMRLAHPNAKMYYELGNHEVRWQRYLENNAHAVRNLVDLSYNTLFHATDLQIEVVPYQQSVAVLPGLLDVTHGDIARKGSGMSARMMLDKGVSGVSGHTHRLGMIYKTDRKGTRVWAENGCLASLTPDYLASPDWHQGFTILWVDTKTEWFSMSQLPIIKGKAFYQGKFYQGD